MPRDLETICLKCLRKQPEQRYSSARELDDLGRFVRGEPVAARPVGVAERVRKWVWRRPAAAGLLVAVALLVAAGGVGAWLLFEQRAAARGRQAQTDREVRNLLERARDLLAEGWRAADRAKLTEAKREADRAENMARSSGASAAVQQEAEAFCADANGRLSWAVRRSIPPVGLDVDRTAEAEVVARLGEEPDVVVQELIAALDRWTMERRRLKRPAAEWRRLVRVADRLDRSERHRQLRALLVGESLPRAESVTGLVGAGPPWPALWRLARGDTWRQLLDLQREIDPRTEPVLSVALLAQALTAGGDVAGAEQVLRRAATARPTQVVLLDALARLLEGQERSRLDDAIGYYRMVRGQRPHLGFALSKALLRARRAAEAEEVLQELLPSHTNNPVFYGHLALVAYSRKKDRETEGASR